MAFLYHMILTWRSMKTIFRRKIIRYRGERILKIDKKKAVIFIKFTLTCLTMFCSCQNSFRVAKDHDNTYSRLICLAWWIMIMHVQHYWTLCTTLLIIIFKIMKSMQHYSTSFNIVCNIIQHSVQH